MIALTILLYLRLIETGWMKDIVILVMIYVLAFLMVSNIRYFSFKELNLAKTKALQHLHLRRPFDDCDRHGACDCALWLSFSLYVFSGPVSMVLAWHKKRAEEDGACA